MVLKNAIYVLVIFLLMLFSGAASGNPLLDEIANGESTSITKAKEKDAIGYAQLNDYAYHSGKYTPNDFNSNYPESLLDMTIGQIKELQIQMINEGGSSAIGKYQIVNGKSRTLTETQAKLGLSNDTKFDAKTQELFAQALLEKRGYVDWLEGKDPNPSNNLDANAEFQDQLAWEWASIADPVTGKGKYPGQRDSRTTTQEIRDAMNQTKLALMGTIPLPAGPAADALKAEGRYEAYLADAAFSYYSNGIMLASKGDYDKAMEAFDSAIELSPENSKLHNDAMANKAKTRVTLTLFVHSEDQNGPTIEDAHVEVKENGYVFNGYTKSEGNIFIPGNPGKWSFNISAWGFNPKNWGQEITETSTIHIALQALQQLDSFSTAEKSSGTSIEGKWKVFIDIPNLPMFGGGTSSIHLNVIFNDDGTLNVPEQNYNEDGNAWQVPATTGRWTQNGDRISWSYGTSSFSGTIYANSMDGLTATGQSWRAERN
jgi:tetratricopeptide (TPR) repeat protein